MIRKLFTESELIAFLNAEIFKFDECKNCKFTSITRLDEEDADGCNWSSANLRCSGQPATVCASSADKVVSLARGKFNVI